MLMGHGVMPVAVIAAVLAVNMDVGVGMRMLVGMEGISMAVFVGMGMGVLVGVLQLDGVFDHKPGAEYHGDQSGIELGGGPFP